MQTYSLLFADTSLFILLLGAIFVHACFQLSVSVLTLLSSHTIGRRLPNSRLLNLNFWYILGTVVAVMSALLVTIAGLRTFGATNEAAATSFAYAIAPIVAILIIAFYYRRGRGTRLWLPRSAAQYITGRAKKTRSSPEAFALGTTTALTELPFAIAPLAIVAYTVQGYSAHLWLSISLIYALAVCMPLIVVAVYISSGHKISVIQRWREESKDFLKWASVIALILLTAYVTVLQRGVSS